MRELVVLGTASQVPTRTRNHNGYLLRWDGEGLLFDPGEGTQRQMIHAGVSASPVTRICLTHVHGDHCFGLPGVLSRMVLDGVAHPVYLHYPASGADVVQALVSVAPPGLDLRMLPHGGRGEIAPGLEVLPLRHRVETYGYRLIEPDGRTLLPERLAAAGIGGPASANCSARVSCVACAWRTSVCRGPGRVLPSSWTPPRAQVPRNSPTASTCWWRSRPSATTTPISPRSTLT